MQASCPFELRVIAVLPDVLYDAETRLHKRFEEHKVHGEWYAVNPALENFIANVVYKYRGD